MVWPQNESTLQRPFPCSGPWDPTRTAPPADRSLAPGITASSFGGKPPGTGTLVLAGRLLPGSGTFAARIRVGNHHIGIRNSFGSHYLSYPPSHHRHQTKTKDTRHSSFGEFQVVIPTQVGIAQQSFEYLQPYQLMLFRVEPRIRIRRKIAREEWTALGTIPLAAAPVASTSKGSK